MIQSEITKGFFLRKCNYNGKFHYIINGKQLSISKTIQHIPFFLWTKPICLSIFAESRVYVDGTLACFCYCAETILFMSNKLTNKQRYLKLSALIQIIQPDCVQIPP